MTNDEPGPSGTASVFVQMRDGDRIWELAAAAAPDGRLSIEVAGSGPDGSVQADLRGTAPPHDLARLGRLLLMAATSEALPTTADFVAEQRRRHPNAYRPWTTADDERLAELAQDGGNGGRSHGGVRAQPRGHRLPAEAARPRR